MKFTGYPSIEQFRTVIKNIQHQAAYEGQDDQDEPIFDYLKPKPTITVKATEKVHGTNAAFCLNSEESWVQSRNNIITPEADNAGCAAFCQLHHSQFRDIIILIAKNNSISLADNTIALFFEWAGGSIQKNSALSGLGKSAILFASCKVVSNNEDIPSTWISTGTFQRPEAGIHNITTFANFEFVIDFNKPEDIQNQLISCMEVIEEESPLGTALGKPGNIGEGIVCEFFYKGVRHAFKVKGAKHSASKVKTLSPVDMEKLALIDKCAVSVIHNWRFDQAIKEVFGDEDLDRKRMGEYLKWVSQDTIKEELDLITEAGFTLKEVMPKVNKAATTYFFQQEQL